MVNSTSDAIWERVKNYCTMAIEFMENIRSLPPSHTGTNSFESTEHS
jgi:hypothetical protein